MKQVRKIGICRVSTQRRLHQQGFRIGNSLYSGDRRQLDHERGTDETGRRKAHRRGHRQRSGLCSIACAM